jgi:hypothetical protein
MQDAYPRRAARELWLISLGVVTSELAETISDDTAREAMKESRRTAINPEPSVERSAMRPSSPWRLM